MATLDRAGLIALLDRLPSDAADRYFRAKGFQITWSWRELWQAAHARAFTVAKVLDLELLRDLHAEVERAIRDGLSYSEFERALLPALKRHGWLPHDSEGWPTQERATIRGPKGQQARVGPWRLRTIYDTNLTVATQVGRWKAMTRPEILAARPYWRYVSILDARTTPACRARHGEIRRADDPWWQTNYPPNHWGCRASVVTVSAAELDEFGWRDRVTEGGQNVWAQAGQAGEGWGFNPGLTAWQPDPTRYPPDLRRHLES